MAPFFVYNSDFPIPLFALYLHSNLEPKIG